MQHTEISYQEVQIMGSLYKGNYVVRIKLDNYIKEGIKTKMLFSSIRNNRVVGSCHFLSTLYGKVLRRTIAQENEIKDI